MAIKPIVVTVCDCCGRLDEQPQAAAKPPKGWKRVTAADMAPTGDTGPSSAPAGTLQVLWDLCPGCYSEMERCIAPKVTVRGLQEAAQACPYCTGSIHPPLHDDTCKLAGRIDHRDKEGSEQ